MKRYLYFLLVFTLFACNSDDGGDGATACTEVLVFGLRIEVLDNTTGNAVGTGITVTATDGNYSEDLEFSGGAWLGAAEREGTYNISITSQLYTPANLNGITVGKTADDCHVVTEERQILISPFAP
ncbi:MAG: hypothetical protein KTR22_07130 [Flavobacteriaceae bacterium]|nr:hypothetical protein [Flavobacteriaceae bacterium]